MSNSRTSITVPVRAHVRIKKSKVQSTDKKKEFANQLLEILHNPYVYETQDPELFVSVIASAVQDMHK